MLIALWSGFVPWLILKELQTGEPAIYTEQEVTGPAGNVTIIFPAKTEGWPSGTYECTQWRVK
jgi:hypothetical protein